MSDVSNYEARTNVGPLADRGAPRRLIDGPTCATILGVSYRHWLRLCDSGAAPWGVKLGHLRRWDEAQLDQWITDGCPSVRTKQRKA